VENDKYPTDKEHKYADDFIFCVALFVFCFVLDKISQFVTQNYKLVMLNSIFK
jgi:hypothetical protein